MHTGHILSDLLADFGVRHVFGVPGGQTCALFDVLHGRDDIRHIICRDERNVAYMADAYARLTNRTGVCDVTVGPGATKLPSGLMEAWCSSIPILCIVSELSPGWRHLYERGAALQAMDQETLMRQFCKWTVTLTAPEETETYLATALRRANSGRSGPVAMVIPDKVFDRAWEGDRPARTPREELGIFPLGRSAPDPEDVTRAASLLGAAKRPFMLCGGGVHISGADEAVRRVVEQLGMPVATTFTGRGTLEDDHSLSLGLLGNMGTDAARDAADAADVVLLVGCKLSQNSSRNWTFPRADQRVIHLDVDAAEIGKVVPTEVMLVGDARVGLQALWMRLVEGKFDGGREAAARLRHAGELRDRWQRTAKASMTSDAVPIMPQRVMHELNLVTDADDILCCDASYVSGWGTIYYALRKPGRRILAPRGSGGLGYGIPAAIGAAFARPDARVIAICGDHAASYSVGELATAAAHGLNIKVILFNNQRSGWIDHYHRVFFEQSGEPFRWADIDFAAVGRGYGCRGVRVTDPGELHAALAEVMAHEGPAVVDVVTSGEETPIKSYQEAVAAHAPGGAV